MVCPPSIISSVLILNHLEPDHTGFTYLVKSLNPDVEIITTKRGAELVEGF